MRPRMIQPQAPPGAQVLLNKQTRGNLRLSQQRGLPESVAVSRRAVWRNRGPDARVCFAERGASRGCARAMSTNVDIGQHLPPMRGPLGGVWTVGAEALHYSLLEGGAEEEWELTIVGLIGQCSYFMVRLCRKVRHVSNETEPEPYSRSENHGPICPHSGTLAHVDAAGDRRTLDQLGKSGDFAIKRYATTWGVSAQNGNLW